MYARKGDLLQFILNGFEVEQDGYEVPYSFAFCPEDVERYGMGMEIDLRDLSTDTYIERDFHRFNVVHSLDKELHIVYDDRAVYEDRPQSSLFVFGEPPDED